MSRILPTSSIAPFIVVPMFAIIIAGTSRVDANRLVEVVVIYLAVVLAPYHDVAHFQNAHNLDHAVVSILREIDHAVRIEFPPQVNKPYILPSVPPDVT